MRITRLRTDADTLAAVLFCQLYVAQALNKMTEASCAMTKMACMLSVYTIISQHKGTPTRAKITTAEVPILVPAVKFEA